MPSNSPAAPYIDVTVLDDWMSTYQIRTLLGISKQAVHHLIWQMGVFDLAADVRALVVGRDRVLYVVRRSAVQAEYDRRVARGRITSRT